MPKRVIDFERIARDRDKNLRHGALVVLKTEYEPQAKKTPHRTLLVVLADKFDMVNCVEPGGRADDELAYWRVPATWVRVIDPATVRVGELGPDEVARYIAQHGVPTRVGGYPAGAGAT